MAYSKLVTRKLDERKKQWTVAGATLPLDQELSCTALMRKLEFEFGYGTKNCLLGISGKKKQTIRGTSVPEQTPLLWIKT